ncbi:MAG: hypothetical protein WD512_03490 [Candidatus Paceibacterota bacterium]
MTNEIMPNEKLISQKANFYKYQKVHITFLNENWENGIIQDIGAEFLLLEFNSSIGIERWGAKSRPFFFIEIKDIEELRERK